MKALVHLWLLALTAGLQAQVTLSEIMFDPIGSEAHNEFVELFNLSSTDSLDLAGWQISDGTGTDTIVGVDQGTVLAPGQFALILDRSYFENSDLYDDIIPPTALVLTIDNASFGRAGLRNSRPETVSLLNPAGEVVSQYTYTTDNLPGFSDEKRDLAGPNTPENWENSRVELGTPGRRNSVSPLEYDLALVALRVTPLEIRAGADVRLSAVVRNVGRQTADDFAVAFFEDRNGDGRATANEALAPPQAADHGLAPADSTEIEFLYPAVTAGEHTVVAQLQFPLDQDSTNNRAVHTFAVAFEPGTVVVNEIMYAPDAGQAEWVELFNPSSAPVNLRGWGLLDSDAELPTAMADDLLLAPQAFHVLAQDSSLLPRFAPPAGSVTVLRPWPSLNNSGDRVVLVDLTGREIERVDYTSDWGGQGGVSLERINPRLAANDPRNWGSSVAPSGGTPGTRNSLFAEVLPSETVLSVAPNPFSPDGDGHDDTAVISYRLPVTTASMNIKIYDLRGRLVRFLANNQPTGSEGAVVWDGLDDAGQKARMGIYVIFLQALNPTQGVLLSEKKTVVLAGRL